MNSLLDFVAASNNRDNIKIILIKAKLQSKNDLPTDCKQQYLATGFSESI